jgi:hypothetical protein
MRNGYAATVSYEDQSAGSVNLPKARPIWTATAGPLRIGITNCTAEDDAVSSNGLTRPLLAPKSPLYA